MRACLRGGTLPETPDIDLIKPQTTDFKFALISMSFIDLKEYTQADIQSLIDNNVEESVHLDFKAAPALDKSERKKEEISKDISSFANSDGGLIVYGISENKEHCAESPSFVDGNEFTKEWLEQVINSKINRRIEGIEIFPVRFENSIAKTVFVVKIPRSSNAPHMCSDHRYYRRFNFSSVPMEEYEVRDLFNRRSPSSMSILELRVYQKNTDKFKRRPIMSRDFTEWSFAATVVNNGKEIEKDFKLNIYLTAENGLSIQDLSWDSVKDIVNYSLWNNGVKISALSNMPIYPEESLDIARFNIRIDATKSDYFIEHTKVRILLLFNGGSDEINTTMKELTDHLNS